MTTAGWPCSQKPSCLYLAVAECTDGAVDGEGRSSGGKDSNSGLLYCQRGTIGIDIREGPVCVCVWRGWVMICVKGRLLRVIIDSSLH